MSVCKYTKKHMFYRFKYPFNLYSAIAINRYIDCSYQNQCCNLNYNFYTYTSHLWPHKVCCCNTQYFVLLCTDIVLA